jgi:RHS repeat-associated protein
MSTQLALFPHGTGLDLSAIGYGYDADSNLTSLTTPSGDAHAMAYSPVNLESVYSPPQDGLPEARTLSEYNLDRQPKTVTRPDALQLVYGYDFGGRPSTLTIPTGVVSLSYDAQGRTHTSSAPSGEVLTYGYDGPLPLTSVWAGPVKGALSVGYDSDLRRAAIGPAGGTALNLAYDADSFLTSVGALQLIRDPASGRLVEAQLGAITEDLGYDTFGDLATISATFGPSPLYGLDVTTRDALGRIALKIETIDGVTHTSSYAYTPKGELRSVLIDGSISTHFTYDSDGNRLTRTSSAGTISATYDTQDRLMAYGAESFTYSANGELATRTNAATGQTTTYHYDVLGNLSHVGLPDGRKVDYIVDGQNRRIGKVIDGALVQAFIYDGALRPIAEFDGAGSLVEQFVYATRGNVPSYIIRGATVLAVLTDHLGCVRAVVDSNAGTLAEAIDFDAWGSVVRDTQPGLQPFGFAGGIYDPDTHLVHFGARDYDPSLGRWLSKDPARFDAGRSNLFSYADGDPINRVDVTGRVPLLAYVVLVLALVDFENDDDVDLTPLALTGATEFTFFSVRYVLAARQAAKAACEAEETAIARGARAIRSYEKRIAEHKAKLEAFRNNPTIKPGMENLSKETVEAQQAKRIQHLEKEIETFQDNIDKIRRDGKL